MNKKLAGTAFILFLTNTLHVMSQSDIATYQQSIVSILRKYSPYQENSYIHKEETTQINTMFLDLLDKIDTYSEDKKSNIRNDFFELLYENSGSAEDGSDVNRKAKRRSLCYQMIAIASDEDKYFAFLQDAKFAINEMHKEEIFKEYILIDLLELLLDSKFYLSDNKHKINQQIQSLRTKIISQKELLEKSFFEDTMSIMRGIE